MDALDFESLGQAPDYLFTKAAPDWVEGDHPRNPDGTFKHSAIMGVLEADAGEWTHADLTRESWGAEFPNGAVSTPIGTLRLGENQFDKLVAKGRDSYFGVLKQTLEHPTFVASETEPIEKLERRAASGEVVQRDHVIKFYRAFRKYGRLVCMCCVSINKDDVEIVISSGERKPKQVATHIARVLSGEGDSILWATTLATQAGIVGREDGVAEPVLKAILDTMPMFVKALDFDSLAKADVQSGNGRFFTVGEARAAAKIAVERYRASHEPTPAQIAAGNYAKRKIAWRGMTISIENEAGSVRSGVDPDGKPWETRMIFPYGYLLRTEAVDGDHVDVYLGPNLDTPFVYVVHQRKVGDWLSYDEDKVFIGFDSEADVVQAFLQHYNDFRFLGPVTMLPADEFVGKARATFDAPSMIKSDAGKGEKGREGEFSLFESLDFGQEMLVKSEHGPIPAGAHWITVHGSPSAKGSPILVMPHEDGSMRVIGGAGGALNHLKLRSVKTGEGYKESPVGYLDDVKGLVDGQACRIPAHVELYSARSS